MHSQCKSTSNARNLEDPIKSEHVPVVDLRKARGWLCAIVREIHVSKAFLLLQHLAVRRLHPAAAASGRRRFNEVALPGLYVSDKGVKEEGRV